MFGTRLEAILKELLSPSSVGVHLPLPLPPHWTLAPLPTPLPCLRCPVFQFPESLVSKAEVALQLSSRFLKEGKSLSRKHQGKFLAQTVLICRVSKPLTIPLECSPFLEEFEHELFFVTVTFQVPVIDISHNLNLNFIFYKCQCSEIFLKGSVNTDFTHVWAVQ